MNSYDKTRFDVLSHLTDIPMLGKQYVPGLWKQFEDGHVTSRHEQSTEHRVGQESISQRNITETSPSTQRTRMNATLENERGLTRSTEKRLLPRTAEPSAAPHLSKVPRIDGQ